MTTSKTNYSDIEIEVVSEQVHKVWIESNLAMNVTSLRSESGEELMVPYRELSEAAKDLDRNTVRAVYAAIEASAVALDYLKRKGLIKRKGEQGSPHSEPGTKAQNLPLLQRQNYRNNLLAIKFNQDMETAPHNRRILALREGGDIGIVKWEGQKHHKNPKPYWADEREYLGVTWCRANQPIGWAELEAETS